MRSRVNKLIKNAVCYFTGGFYQQRGEIYCVCSNREYGHANNLHLNAKSIAILLPSLKLINWKNQILSEMLLHKTVTVC